MHSISHKATPTQQAVATPKSWASGHSRRIPVAAQCPSHQVKQTHAAKLIESSHKNRSNKKNHKQTLDLMKNKSSLSHFKTVFGDIG